MNSLTNIGTLSKYHRWIYTIEAAGEGFERYILKAELLQEGIFFLLQLFARDVLVMKKLEIEKTKPTFIISTFKTDIITVGLVFSISNFFIAKTSLANNWRSFSSSYLALCLR